MEKYEYQVIMANIKEIEQEQLSWMEYVCNSLDAMVDVQIIKSHELNQKLGKVKAVPSYIDKEYVFATAIGESLDAKNFFKSYKSLLIKANIPHKKFHALRHYVDPKVMGSVV